MEDIHFGSRHEQDTFYGAFTVEPKQAAPLSISTFSALHLVPAFESGSPHLSDRNGPYQREKRRVKSLSDSKVFRRADPRARCRTSLHSADVRPLNILVSLIKPTEPILAFAEMAG